MKLLFLCCLLVFGHWAGLAQDPGPTVCLEPQGTCYLGSWARTNRGNLYSSFQGVRYAQAPEGPLRFLAPQPFNAGEVVLDVSGESKIKCSQRIWKGEGDGQEDCLLLNIYAPEHLTDVLLPVMVWIHGGANTVGSNLFTVQGPQHFLNREVVVVAVNYRLGPLGFLSLGTEEVSGNAGLRDQVMALTWIQDNIAMFGGDPGMVTLYGESAGSSNIAYHLLSPLTVGLFQRAIFQSGTALGVGWGGPVSPEHALTYSSLLAEHLDCPGNEDILPCLQAANVSELVDKSDLMDGGTVWQAVNDFTFTSSPYLPGDPEDLLRSGEFNKEVEIVIGTTDNEGIIDILGPIKNNSEYDYYKENWETLGIKMLLGIADVNDITKEDISKAEKILDFYIGGLNHYNDEHRQGLIDMYTDSSMLYGTFKTINYLVQHGVTVFQYILTYEGEYSFTLLYNLDPVGVCHGDDLIYLWEPVFQWDPSEYALSGEDLLVRDIMNTAWTDFAKYGDPAPPNSGLVWEPRSQDKPNRFLNISGAHPNMATSKDINERIQLWANVIG